MHTEDWASTEAIHCPNESCTSCVINGFPSFYSLAMNLTIYGYNCSLLTIDLKQIIQGTIHAPANGTLILQSGVLANTAVYSYHGTQNMIIHTHLPLNISDPYAFETGGNYIDGRYVEGYLNYTVSGLIKTYKTLIICNKSCNINCLSERTSGCVHMIVRGTSGISSINWYCLKDSSQCMDSRVNCSNVDNPLVWSEDYGWYFLTDHCIQNWTGVKPLSCTYKGDNLCFIGRQMHLYTDQNIKCDQKYTRCEVQISGGAPISTSRQWTVFCPSDVCEECKIKCEDYNSCSQMTVQGYDCAILSVDIISSHHQNVSIYAPGSGGKLYFNVLHDENIRTYRLYYFNIYSSPGTYDMILDLSKCYRCQFNQINGTFVTHALNFTCSDEGYFQFGKIVCPNVAECDVYCVSVMPHACFKMSMYAQKGTNDLNWVCNGYNCEGSELVCDDGISEWTTNSITNEFQWKPMDCVDPPTNAPTPSPTLFSKSPTTSAPTILPTNAPTNSPTAAPITFEWFEKIDMNEIDAYIVIICVILGLIVLVFCVSCCIYRCQTAVIREKRTIYINNGLVLVISIGHYDVKICDDMPDIACTLSDLDGIEKDVENVNNLFKNNLNYDVFYNTDNSDCIKTTWTENEIKYFLEEKSGFLDDNIETGNYYDGLIVVVSCHGLENYLCTSDYRTFSKQYVHRIFSWTHPKTRTIPRLFIIDCCSGDQEYVRELSEHTTSKNATTLATEYSKNVEEKDMKGASNYGWIEGQNNPDYLLAIVNASNPGFQSKMNTENGSYLINKFCEESLENLQHENGKFIHEIFENIQSELHQKGKQHPTYEWNDATNYIRFKKKIANKNHVSETAIELVSQSKANKKSILKIPSHSTAYSSINTDEI
eukprot:364242_1